MNEQALSNEKKIDFERDAPLVEYPLMPRLAAAWSAYRIKMDAIDRKLWLNLGFGNAKAPIMAIDRKYGPDMLVTQVKIKLNLRELIRVIISRRIMIATSMLTHPQVKRSKSQSAVSILPPGDDA